MLLLLFLLFLFLLYAICVCVCVCAVEISFVLYANCNGIFRNEKKERERASQIQNISVAFSLHFVATPL